MCKCCGDMNRRHFMGLTAGMIAGAALASAVEPGGSLDPGLWDPAKPYAIPGKPLIVQPVLMFRVSEPREASSWKSWGGVQSVQAASKEASRIAGELAAMTAGAEFPIEVRPVVSVRSKEELDVVHATDYDVILVYAATGSGDLLRACLSPRGNTIVFVRHLSGPVYYWYEALSVKYLTDDAAKEGPPRRVGFDDVVVDDYGEVLWRLRALYGAKNFLGARVVALGGVGGKYADEAPRDAQSRYGMELIDVGYDVFAPRLERALADERTMKIASQWTDAYLAMPDTELKTDRTFVVNAFVLYALFKELIREHDAAAFTIQHCMGTILPMAKTTACLTLGLLNDEGLLAFCESDFVVIPAGILLHYVSGKPVFMHNSTFPHKGVVTCAHCTAPRRMDGARYEPAEILTHYESEFGAAPKVTVPVGQEVTFIDPEYSTGRWIGLKGTVEGNPFLDICRSQQDVRIQGDWKRLIREVRDSHWMMAYGGYLDELGYAARKIGVQWDCIEPV
ncbi:MAG: hypothetical protein QG656_479 [Candidatus Hydrogenedentes bacterium]|nr:hypothetical protein [Candidatus Hydrogenedentota bacterium]